MTVRHCENDTTSELPGVQLEGPHRTFTTAAVLRPHRSNRPTALQQWLIVYSSYSTLIVYSSYTTGKQRNDRQVGSAVPLQNQREASGGPRSTGELEEPGRGRHEGHTGAGQQESRHWGTQHYCTSVFLKPLNPLLHSFCDSNSSSHTFERWPPHSISYIEPHFFHNTAHQSPRFLRGAVWLSFTKCEPWAWTFSGYNDELSCMGVCKFVSENVWHINWKFENAWQINWNCALSEKLFGKCVAEQLIFCFENVLCLRTCLENGVAHQLKNGFICNLVWKMCGILIENLLFCRSCTPTTSNVMTSSRWGSATLWFSAAVSHLTWNISSRRRESWYFCLPVAFGGSEIGWPK